ncbi:hypothetical protein H8D30_02410 [bacterium]|nr:hypothetical protein [bacterium]
MFNKRNGWIVGFVLLLASCSTKEVTEAFSIALRSKTTEGSVWDVAAGTIAPLRLSSGRVGVWLPNEQGMQIGEQGNAAFLADELDAALERSLIRNGATPISLETLDVLTNNAMDAGDCGPYTADADWVDGVELGDEEVLRIHLKDGEVSVERTTNPKDDAIAEEDSEEENEVAANNKKTVNCALRTGFPLGEAPGDFLELELSEDRWGSAHELLRWGVSHPAFMAWLGDVAEIETLVWLDGLQQKCNHFSSYGYPLDIGSPRPYRIAEVKALLVEWVHRASFGGVAPDLVREVVEDTVAAIVALLEDPDSFGSMEFSSAIKGIVDSVANEDFFDHIDKRGFLEVVKAGMEKAMENDLWICEATGRARLLDMQTSAVLAGADFTDRWIWDANDAPLTVDRNEIASIDSLQSAQVAERLICLWNGGELDECVQDRGYRVFEDFDVLIRTTKKSHKGKASPTK